MWDPLQSSASTDMDLPEEKKKEIWAPHEQWVLLFARVSSDVVMQLHSLVLAIRAKLHEMGDPVWHLSAAERGRAHSLSFHLSFPARRCSSAVLLSCTNSSSAWKQRLQCDLGSTRKTNYFFLLFSKTFGLKPASLALDSEDPRLFLFSKTVLT